MDIKKENIDDLNAVLRVKVGPEDYEQKVDGAVKSYQKKVNMPGFRPGKVPVGMIKKMYGKSILVDEINRILQDSLYEYLRQNNIEVLGHPLPKMEDNIDWDNQKEFTFSYDLGLAPQFNVNLGSDQKFTKYKIKIDDELINKYVDDIRRRYGNIANPETADKEDVVFGEFKELEANGNDKEGGIIKNSSLAIDRIKDEELKNKFVGLKKDDSVEFTVEQMWSNQTDLSHALAISKEEAENLKGNFKFTVFNISRMGKAEMNEELFKKVYGEEVKTEEEFKNKIREELSSMFDRESDMRLKNDIVKGLIEDVKIQLPDEFLKRWLIAANEKPVTMDQVNAEYDSYAKGLRWQLIENKIIKDNQIKVDTDEVKEYVKGLIREQYRKYNQSEIDETELEGTVDRVLKNEKEAEKIWQKLYDDKVLTLFKSKLAIEEKEVSYDDFYKQDQQ